jgi:hypothetical protein
VRIVGCVTACQRHRPSFRHPEEHRRCVSQDERPRTCGSNRAVILRGSLCSHLRMTERGRMTERRRGVTAGGTTAGRPHPVGKRMNHPQACPDPQMTSLPIPFAADFSVKTRCRGCVKFDVWLLDLNGRAHGLQGVKANHQIQNIVAVLYRSMRRHECEQRRRHGRSEVPAAPGAIRRHDSGPARPLIQR